MIKVTLFSAIISVLIVFCKQKDQFQKIATTDVLLTIPKPGEWLAEHPEKGQTFEQYSLVKTIKKCLGI